MSQPVSLKEVEKQVFRAAVQDGLWDILIGFFILAFALAPGLSRTLGDFWSSAVLFGTWPFIAAAVWLVRRHVVAPRVGVVQFGRSRIRRLMWFNVVMALALFAAFVLGLGGAILSRPEAGALPGWLPMIVLGLICLGLSGIAAYFLDYPRLNVYGVLLALATPVGEWLYRTRQVPHHGIPLTFGLTAALAILVGLVRFAQLLRDHPLPGDLENSAATPNG